MDGKGPRFLARYKKEENGGRLIGEFGSLESLYSHLAGYGTPPGWVEVGLWSGEVWEWHDFGHLTIRHQ